MDSTKLPLEYLLTSSQSGLEGFELGRLNQISNLRKELRDIVDEWVQAEIEAELARWLLESRRAQEAAAPGSPAPEISFPLPGAEIAAAFLRRIVATSVSEPQARVPVASLERMAPRVSVGTALLPRKTRARRRKTSPASEEAQGSLNFLEQHARSQTDALGPQLHPPNSWSISRTGESNESPAPAARSKRDRTRPAAPIRAGFRQFALHHRRFAPVC